MDNIYIVDLIFFYSVLVNQFHCVTDYERSNEVNPEKKESTNLTITTSAAALPSDQFLNGPITRTLPLDPIVDIPFATTLPLDPIVHSRPQKE